MHDKCNMRNKTMHKIHDKCYIKKMCKKQDKCYLIVTKYKCIKCKISVA